MAKYGSDDAFLLVDGYNVTGVSTDFEDTIEAVLERTDGLGDSWEEQSYVGLRRASIAQNGFYDDEALSSNAALNAQQGTSRLLMYGLAGNTLGKKVTCYQGAMQVDVSRVASRGALHKLNVSYLGSGEVSDAVILHALGEETEDDDNSATSFDGTAQSSDGGIAFLQVTALDLDGYDDVTITVLDDADDTGTFGTLVAFTDVSAAQTAQRMTVAGTVERYLAVSWEFNGTGTSPSISFIVGFKRN